jgi:hypothetical protein
MSTTRTQSSSELWLQYLESLPWIKGSLDVSTHNAFLRAVSLGVPNSTAIEEATQRIRVAGGHVRPNKIQSQWRRAQMHLKAEPSSPGPIIPVERPAFDPGYAKRIAERVPATVDRRWIRHHSPVSPGWITPAEYLSAVFRHGDQVLVFSNYLSQGEALYQNWSIKVPREALQAFVRGHLEGVWFMSNPVDGLYHYNPRQGRESRRSEESITAFRHVVLESDCQPADQWLRILVQLKLPVVSIVSSGGKSLHALCRIDASSKKDWDRRVKHMMPHLVRVGADRGAMTAVRLTRLPGCHRGDKLQQLFYLDPQAKGGPIYKGEQTR